MTSSRSTRPRRSHTLGACRTCRRRHVKCDQKRPVCRTCRTLGVPCEGFTSEVRWMRNTGEDKKIEDQNGTRRHLYTEESRESMSDALGTNLLSGSISASLAEIDSRTRDPERPPVGDIVVGPFAVLDFAPDGADASHKMPPEPQGKKKEHPEPEVSQTQLESVPFQTVAAQDPQIELPTLLNDSPSHIDDFLHWSDILGLSPEQPGFFQPSMVDFDMYFGGQQDGAGEHAFAIAQDIASVQDTTALLTPPGSALQMASTFLDAAALADAPFLFKHFNESVVPQMLIMPLGDKSPWRIMNLSAAMATYNDLTILGSQTISHARLANLYGILACSAVHLSTAHGTADPATHWQQGACQMFEQARDHMQKSLKYETRDPKRAKYKDQLMAISSLIQYTVISGQHQHTRSFMVNAEYVVRMRGLKKHRISQKARLLHHVYTWLRLVGESTYVLHDYNPSSSFIEALGLNFLRRRTDPVPDEHNPRLDDFLRLEAHDADSDLNINETKDKQTGLHDIHLQDSRSYPDTLYKQISGVPETWLSLLSQTTRLANVMETFRNAQKSRQDTSLEAWETLHRRSVRLENLICSGDLALPRAGSSKPQAHMLRALNAALVIFFYRRIRRVHPAIMASHVDSVILSLADFTAALPQEHRIGPGAAWPAFIAGCEALTASRREALLQWIETTISTCGPAGFSTARDIMVELWRRQDDHLEMNRGDPMPTWTTFIQERQIWPLFC
ncbi:fungal-specific transcription factor domain-containing protein [Aspergillus karnatakaensis]|uniref:Zn(II)2Cys6 transcription factor n=1 Tax=Aspergillus karnatakaensis TaxID=1810916 RepID=UPI003CCCC2CD